jgi:hypothetical protein
MNASPDNPLPRMNASRGMNTSRRVCIKASRGTRFLRTVTLAIAMLIISSGAYGGENQNLLNNADFSHGSGNSVDEWRTDAWILTPGTTDYLWVRPEGGQPGEVELSTHLDNDARWVQQLSLGPGWYYISADARTVGALPTFTGANISVLEDGISSADIKGDSDWQHLGLYLKIGPRGADIDVAMRLGGYMNLTRGQAFFRNASVVRVAAPPPGSDYTYDLDQIRKDEVSGPIGRLWTLVATFIGFAVLAAVGWLMLGAPAAQSIATATAPVVDRPRRKRS